jgi:hypothetical protein
MGGSALSAQTPAVQIVQATDEISAALDAAPEVDGGHVIVHHLSMHPDGGAPPIIINFVSDGPAQGGVPCINCVNGASTGDNIGLTGPSSYIPLNATWQYSLSFTDVAYKGPCTLAWAITGGGKTIDSFSAKLNLTSKGGFVLYALNRNRPAYHGGATLTGKVTCGASKPTLSAPLHFQ